MANTGRKIVLTLKEVENPGASETGDTKNNLTSDPDYIAPYIDTEDCPITFSTTCPVVVYTADLTALQYEFSLGNDVVNNPSIARIDVSITPADAAAHSYVLPNATPNFFSGSFTGLDIGETYAITVTYYDGSNNVVNTCNIA